MGMESAMTTECVSPVSCVHPRIGTVLTAFPLGPTVEPDVLKRREAEFKVKCKDCICFCRLPRVFSFTITEKVHKWLSLPAKRNVNNCLNEFAV